MEVPTLGDMEGFLKVAIPDELRDSIIWKTLPVRPNMNTKDVCKFTLTINLLVLVARCHLLHKMRDFSMV